MCVQQRPERFSRSRTTRTRQEGVERLRWLVEILPPPLKVVVVVSCAARIQRLGCWGEFDRVVGCVEKRSEARVQKERAGLVDDAARELPKVKERGGGWTKLSDLSSSAREDKTAGRRGMEGGGVWERSRVMLGAGGRSSRGRKGGSLCPAAASSSSTARRPFFDLID
jgi:hypothetical protein